MIARWVALAGLILAASIASAQTTAHHSPEERGCETLNRLGSSFGWTLPAVTGIDENGNGLMDLNSATARRNARYGMANVRFDATGLGIGGGFEYRWRFERESDGRSTGDVHVCDDSETFTTRSTVFEQPMCEGVHRVSLTAVGSGGECWTKDQDIVVNSIVIVSIGDSLSSGESNPDVPKRLACWPSDPLPWCGIAWVWADDALQVCDSSIRMDTPDEAWLTPPEKSLLLVGIDATSPRALCDAVDVDRSSTAWPVLLARRMEAESDKTSVSLIFLPQTGASVKNGILASRRGAGSDYSGVGSFFSSFARDVYMGHSQFERAVVLSRYGTIDHLLISTGTNDLGFGTVIKTMVMDGDGANTSQDNYFSFDDPLNPDDLSFQDNVRQLPDRLAELGRRIDSELPVLGTSRRGAGSPDRKNVYILEYPNPLRDENGGRPAIQATDILFGVGGISSLEAGFGEFDVLRPLNLMIAEAAAQNHWTYLAGIHDEFAHDAEGRGHGYAAADPHRWITTATESRNTQEPGPTSKGTYHPNALGHQAILRLVDPQIHRDVPHAEFGPLEVDEGTRSELEAAPAFPNADDEWLERGTEYHWDLDLDGRFDVRKGHGLAIDRSTRVAIFDATGIPAESMRLVRLRTLNKDTLNFSDFEFPLHIRPVPFAYSVSATASVDEGAPYALSITISHPVAAWLKNTESVRVDWGDGSETSEGVGVARFKTLTHQYSTGGASFPIQVFATEPGAEERLIHSGSVAVADTPPRFRSDASLYATSGLSYVLGSLIDPDSEFSISSIDWGDGVVQPVSVGSFPLIHLYTLPGTYEISVAYTGTASGLTRGLLVSVGPGRISGRILGAPYPSEFEVFVDDNGNSLLDPGERSVIAVDPGDGIPTFALEGIPAGSHEVRVVGSGLRKPLQRVEYFQRNPGSGRGFTIAIGTGNPDWDDLDFEFSPIYDDDDSAWAGTVFLDQDRDGVFGGDPPLDGIAIVPSTFGSPPDATFVTSADGRFWIFSSNAVSPDLSDLSGYQQSNAGFAQLEGAAPSGPWGSIDYTEKFWHQSRLTVQGGSCSTPINIAEPIGYSRAGIACVLSTMNGTHNLDGFNDLTQFGDPSVPTASEVYGQPLVRGYSLWSEFAYVPKGTVVTFDWNLLTNETDDRPTDFAVVEFGGTAAEIANISAANLPGIPPSEGSLAYARQTGWRRGYVVAGQSGPTDLAFAVANESDGYGDSALLIDNLEVLGTSFPVRKRDYPSEGNVGLIPANPAPSIPGPAGAQATDGEFADRVRITWSDAPGASGFVILRGPSEDVASAAVLAQVEEVSSFDDLTATSETRYFYWIEARYRVVLSEPASAGTGYAGVAPPPQLSIQWGGLGVYSAQASPIPFGEVLWGQTGAVRTFSVTNSGGRDLALTQIRVPAGFVLTDGLRAALSPGEGDSFSVLLPGSAIGAFSASIEIDSDDPANATFVIPVSGSVRLRRGPELLLTANGMRVRTDLSTSLAAGTDFDAAILGGSPAERVYVLSNPGEAILTLSGLQVPMGFEAVSSLPSSLFPGESAGLALRMISDTAGVKQGEVRFFTNLPNEPEVIFTIRGVVTVLGDVNRDLVVNIDDFTVWSDHYGYSPFFAYGDLNGDGLASLADYTIWADNFGSSALPPAPLPAPPVEEHLALPPTASVPPPAIPEQSTVVSQPDTLPPTLVLLGQESTRRRRVELSGSAQDDGAVARVRFRVRHGKKHFGKWQPAQGREHWKVSVPARKWRNYVVEVSAIDGSGNESRLQTPLAPR